jgi:MFS family permease
MTEKHSHRGLVVAAIMASMAMIAVEATIVSTAMPQIAAQLGQLNLYSWVFSSFLLTQTATTVVFGKLADIYGRKPVLVVGIALFLVASVLAGFAWSMPSMIVFRLLQGIGAGAIQPAAMTVVADLFPGAQRSKVQGYLASVWALSAVVGPLLGSLIIHNLSWAWVFWINVPVGILAASGFLLFLHEEKRSSRVSVDVLGAALFAVSISSLMIALTLMENAVSLEGILALALFGVSLVAFIWQERRAKEPMVAPDLWLKRPIAFSNLAVFLASMSIMGLTTFLPMYVQTVLNRSPVVAGFALTMLLLVRSDNCIATVYAVWTPPNHDCGQHLYSDRNVAAGHAHPIKFRYTGRRRFPDHGVRYGTAQHRGIDPDTGQRELVGARQCHGIKCLLAQFGQYARSDCSGRGADLWSCECQSR